MRNGKNWKIICLWKFWFSSRYSYNCKITWWRSSNRSLFDKRKSKWRASSWRPRFNLRRKSFSLCCCKCCFTWINWQQINWKKCCGKRSVFCGKIEKIKGKIWFYRRNSWKRTSFRNKIWWEKSFGKRRCFKSIRKWVVTSWSWK